MREADDRREEYVKPSITRLEYEADVKVSMANTCKVATVGPGTGGDCTSDLSSGTPCANVAS